MNRRGFLGLNAAASAAFFFAGDVKSGVLEATEAEQHRKAALRVRVEAATAEAKRAIAEQVTTGDEERYSDKRASFSKTLPHNQLGEVLPEAYRSFVDILTSGDRDRFSKLPRVPEAEVRLNNPQAAYAYELAGLDTHSTAIAWPPPFASPNMAAEMGELYWQALTRDVPYREYESHSLIAAAVSDLKAFSVPIGPITGGSLRPETLFRGESVGDLIGPYLSQFLWRPVPLGATELDQREKRPIAGQRFLNKYQEWLACQRGMKAKDSLILDTERRYLRSSRDLAEYVRRIFNIQPYLNAALIALSFGEEALSITNPYRGSRTEFGDITFGGKNVIALLGQAALIAEKAAWYEKWLVHRRLRPEAFGARVHNELCGNKSYGLTAELLDCDGVSRSRSANSTGLLPIAYPEGCPTHPSYPAAHATVAGACTTILKAFFNEDFVIANPVQASSDGLSLDAWTGPRLTLGNEINKLASNISFGRNAAGVHYRSDSIQGLNLGEEHAIGLLRDYARTYHERFAGFVLTRFNGKRIRISEGDFLEVQG